jgi:hypothetical protein
MEQKANPTMSAIGWYGLLIGRYLSHTHSLDVQLSRVFLSLKIDKQLLAQLYHIIVDRIASIQKRIELLKKGSVIGPAAQELQDASNITSLSSIEYL